MECVYFLYPFLLFFLLLEIKNNLDLAQGNIGANAAIEVWAPGAGSSLGFTVMQVETVSHVYWLGSDRMVLQD